MTIHKKKVFVATAVVSGSLSPANFQRQCALFDYCGTSQVPSGFAHLFVRM
jgi:hypothetical protein